MVAQELRIGNWVHVSLMDRSLSTDRLIHYRDFESIYGGWLLFEPIPLTSEWLEKCKNDDYGFYQQSDGSYSLIDDYGDGSTYYIGNLRYVHQLQNLYFALTGQELTIKDDGKERKLAEGNLDS